MLTREHSQEPEPEKRLRRFFFRARIAFLGISYKLSPPRRLLSLDRKRLWTDFSIRTKLFEFHSVRHQIFQRQFLRRSEFALPAASRP